LEYPTISAIDSGGWRERPDHRLFIGALANDKPGLPRFAFLVNKTIIFPSGRQRLAMALSSCPGQKEVHLSVELSENFTQ